MKTAQERYKKLDEILGEGSYKTVTKAVDEEEGKDVAYNEMKISVFEDETKTNTLFSKEITMLKSMDHPYIIKILDYWTTDKNFVFITELMTGGTLRDYITKFGPLNRRLIKKWGRQILEGLKYLHTQDPVIIHRDIKNENIFVNSSTGEIKIGDLGIAREKKHKRYTIVGTPSFMAHEMFDGEGYCEKVDIYAFGLCLVEMSTGQPLSGKVMSGPVRGVEDKCLRSLIMCCLMPSGRRYSAEECLGHHFFSNDEECEEDCVLKESRMIMPLCESVPGMELSVIYHEGAAITFQVLVLKTLKFIKFDYNCETDSVKKVAGELIAEKILDETSIELFVELLDKGIKKLKNGKETGNKNMYINTPPVAFEEGDKIKFGEKTLEVMKEIEEEMQLIKQRNEIKAETDKMKLAEAKSAETIESIDFVETEETTITNLTTNSEVIRTTNSAKTSDLNKIIETVSISQTKSFGEENCDIGLNMSEGYEAYRTKYQTNCNITQFAYDTAAMTGRSEETAKCWIKSLKDDGITSVFDLKLLVYEDWEKLSLTVFSARAMQNMIYGVDNIPGKERQLPMLSKIKEYDNKMSIKEFLTDVCKLIGRFEDLSVWENKLMAQDIRTVGELKSLHQDDWNRLGLSVFAYRILKNIIFRKGRIIL